MKKISVVTIWTLLLLGVSAEAKADTAWGVCETMGKADKISGGYNAFTGVSKPFEIEKGASRSSMARSFTNHVQGFLDNARGGWEVNSAFSNCTKWKTKSRANEKFYDLKDEARGKLLLYPYFNY